MLAGNASINVSVDGETIKVELGLLELLSSPSSMDVLWHNQTLFKSIDVFDLDYLPEEYLHRDKQISQLASNLRPALMKSRSINTLCLGPPSTGKTTAVKLLFKSVAVILVYVNCQMIIQKRYSRKFMATLYHLNSVHEGLLQHTEQNLG